MIIHRYTSCSRHRFVRGRVYLDLAELNTHCDTSHISERVIMIDIKLRSYAEPMFFFEHWLEL